MNSNKPPGFGLSQLLNQGLEQLPTSRIPMSYSRNPHYRIGVSNLSLLCTIAKSIETLATCDNPMSDLEESWSQSLFLACIWLRNSSLLHLLLETIYLSFSRMKSNIGSSTSKVVVRRSKLHRTDSTSRLTKYYH
jgi:hypothetical protein